MSAGGLCSSPVSLMTGGPDLPWPQRTEFLIKVLGKRSDEIYS
jgi:hypothetical protein